jgi:hypothetical protein
LRQWSAAVFCRIFCASPQFAAADCRAPTST